MKFEKLNDDAILPTLATEGSAGYDVYSSETIVIPPWCRSVIPTGITAYFSDNLCLKIASRSGLAFKNGITAFHGTIDSDYAGNEIKVLAFNHTDKKVILEKGSRVAQFLLQPILKEIPAAIMNQTRTGGFGSTGK